MTYAIKLLEVVIGALERRWWGGWFAPNSLLKRGVVLFSSFGSAWFTYGELWPALVASIVTVFCFLMPKHGWAMEMGRNPERPLWKCITVMSLQYGGASLVGAVSVYFLGHVYLPLGFLVPWVYWACWKLPYFKFGEYPKGNCFIDGQTCVAELGLGGILALSIWG